MTALATNLGEVVFSLLAVKLFIWFCMDWRLRAGMTRGYRSWQRKNCCEAGKRRLRRRKVIISVKLCHARWATSDSSSLRFSGNFFFCTGVRAYGFTPSGHSSTHCVAVATGLDRLIGEPADSPCCRASTLRNGYGRRTAIQAENSIATMIWPTTQEGRYRDVSTSINLQGIQRSSLDLTRATSSQRNRC